jgi:signal transduction histidine kinase
VQVLKDLILDKVWGLEADVEMNNIEIYIHYLRKKLNPETCGAQIETIRGDWLLFLARADSNQDIVLMKLFPLHTALLEAYIPFEALALQAKIQLEDFKGSEIDFYGDEARIKQLVVILIDNAISYTLSGGRVGLELKSIADTIEISVTDTGAGIDKEHVDKMFQRFYRVDKSRSRKEGNLGLGLSLAEWIAKEHNE